MQPPKRKIVLVKLSKLKQHPRQAELFQDLPPPRLKALAKHMAKNGVEVPVEILPDYTVIAGHQRTLAANLLGWTKIRCKVRDDLAAAGDAAVEQRLIEDNLNRRQLSRLEAARCFQRLKELGARTSRNGKGDLRDILSKEFNLSGRSLDRYARLLDTPLEVQRAVDAQKLPLVLAGRVADLSQDVQSQIADGIRRGQNAAAVVRAHLPDGGKAEKKLGTALSHFVNAVGRGVAELRGRIEKEDLSDWESDLPVLRHGKDVLNLLIRRIEASCRGVGTHRRRPR